MADTEKIEQKTVENCPNVNSDKIETESSAGQQEILTKESISNETIEEIKQPTAEDGAVNASKTDLVVSSEMDVTEEVAETKTTDEETKTVDKNSVQSKEMQPNEQIKVDEKSIEDSVPAKVVETKDETAEDETAEAKDKAVEAKAKDAENKVEETEHKVVEARPQTSVNDINMETEADTKIQSTEQHVLPATAVNSIGSLGLLNQYASSSDEDEDSSSDDDSESGSDSDESEKESDDTSSIEVIEAPSDTDKNLDAAAKSILDSVMSRANYRDVSSDSSDTDSDVECLGNVAAQTIDITNDDDIQEFLDSCEDNTPSGPIKAKGELGIEDLPPIEELTITVPESDCVELGKISGIVDTLVLVESLPNFAAVDIDTVLFLEKGNRTLGQVFDVMGNVSSPIYCVRFNNAQDISTKNIVVGLTVYVAPQTEYTNFIVLSDLMSKKGCDASWENDVEAPEGCGEFSDDEEERLNRRKQSQRQRNKNRPSESEHPNKVTVKTEPKIETNAGNHKARRPKFQRGRHNDHNTPRFYKDNRGYANVNPDANNYYQHQRMQPPHHNYSWHTATMHGMPPAATTSRAMPYGMPPYAPNQGIAPNMYPNPFAMQSNQLNYASPFSLQAFPPLPPPISSIPPHHQPQQFHRKKSGPFQQK